MPPNSTGVWLQGTQTPQSAGRNTGRTRNPQPVYNPGTGNQRIQGNISYPGGGSSGQAGGGGGPSAADIANQQKAQQIAQLKETIQAKRARANQIFEALTGAVKNLAREKRGSLENQFQQEQTRATEDYTARGDELGRVYAARGLGDSSYRTNALDLASRDFERSIEDLGAQRRTGLAKVGSEAVNELAAIRADKGSIASYVKNIGELGNDVGALRTLRNKIDDRIREAQVTKAKLGTQKGYTGRLAQIAPYEGTTSALSAALKSLVQSATPSVVKDRLAGALIANYDPSNSAEWRSFYSQEKEKVASPTSTGG